MANKIRAFTVLELLVGMTIGAIVMTLAVGAYFMVRKMSEERMGLLKQSDRTSELNYLLIRDMEESLRIAQLGPQAMRCQMNGHQVVYELQATNLLRHQGLRTDTFNEIFAFELMTENGKDGVDFVKRVEIMLSDGHRFAYTKPLTVAMKIKNNHGHTP